MFSTIFLSATEAFSASTAVVIAIVALACLFCAELVGIYLLVNRLKKLRDPQKNKTARHYGFGLFLLAGSVGQGTYTALTVLAVLVGVGALALVGLVTVLRVMGYEFMPSKSLRKKAEKPAPAVATEEPAEEPLDEPAEEPATEEYADEEVVFEHFAEEPLDEDVELVDLFEEEPTDEEEFCEEEPEAEVLLQDEKEETEEVTELQDSKEETEAFAEEAETENNDTEEAGEEATVVSVVSEADKGDGQPYRVVEKIVTETVKEVYKEAPGASGGVNDSVVEKLVDLLDYELRTRRELELADAAKKAAAEGAAVAAVASVAAEEDEDEDEDAGDELDETMSDSDEEGDAENDPESDRFTGNERIIGFNEATGCYIVAHYRKSFEAKLIQARPNIKQYYSELKNALLSYKGSKNRISWTADSFHNGRTPIAKINVKTRILELYLALDPASLEGTVYRGKNVGDMKKYADTPFQYKLRTPRKFKWAMELVQRVCEEKGLTPIDIEKVDYEAQYAFDTTENLVERKLIKEYIREEKPASSFELDPDHVPETLTEDETVIPANANFSWEFDNDRMVEKEPDPIIEEEAPEENDLQEAPPVAETIAEVLAEVEPVEKSNSDVVRETVKVTETRYTERYYTDKPVCEQEVIVTESVESPEENKDEEALSSAVVEEEQDAEASDAEAQVEEPADEQDPLRAHEVVYADDEFYGAAAVYAPVELHAEQDAEIDEEEAPVFEDETDEAPIFGKAFEEVPYEETPFEDILIAEADEPDEEIVYDETAAEEKDFEESDAPLFADDEPVFEQKVEADAQDAQAETVTEEPTEQPARREDRRAYGERHLFEETYAQEEERDVRPIKVFHATAPGKFNPSVAVIDICSVEAAFRAGEVISLDTLKERGLVLAGVSTLNIYASGPIGKAFVVEANQITVDAVRAISAAHGDVIMVK